MTQEVSGGVMRLYTGEARMDESAPKIMFLSRGARGPVLEDTLTLNEKASLACTSEADAPPALCLFEPSKPNDRRASS